LSCALTDDELTESSHLTVNTKPATSVVFN
jgi:hypothetical protein